MAKQGNMNFEIPAEMRALAEKSVEQAQPSLRHLHDRGDPGRVHRR